MHTRLSHGLFSGFTSFWALFHLWKKIKGLDNLFTSKIERVIWNSIRTVMYGQLFFHGNKAIHKSTGFGGRKVFFPHSINSFQLPALETFFWKKLYKSSLVLKVLMTVRHLISKPSLGLASKAFVRDLTACQFKHPISLILTKKKPYNILATWLHWYALTQQWNESNWMQGYRSTVYMSKINKDVLGQKYNNHICTWTGTQTYFVLLDTLDEMSL